MPDPTDNQYEWLKGKPIMPPKPEPKAPDVETWQPSNELLARLIKAPDIAIPPGFDQDGKPIETVGHAAPDEELLIPPPPPPKRPHDHVWLIPVCPGHDPSRVVAMLDQEQIILVDDGAGLDQSNYDSKFVKVVKTGKPWSGCARALNVGLDACEGPWNRTWIYRMDADDTPHPEHDRNWVADHADPDDVVWAGEMTRLDGRKLCITPADCRDVAAMLALRRNPIYHPATILRKDALERVGGWPEKYGKAEDYALWCTISRIGRIQPHHRCWTIYGSMPLKPWDAEDRQFDLVKAARAYGL